MLVAYLEYGGTVVAQRLSGCVWGAGAYTTLVKLQMQQEKKEEEQNPHVSRHTLIIGGLLLLILVVGGILYWLHARQFVKTDDAYTTGHVHQVGSRVAGYVSEVHVDDNQHVNAGDVLVVLDPRDYEVGLSRARSALQNAASVASLMLTTEALIAEKPKDEKPAAGGGHSHGGMGGGDF